MDDYDKYVIEQAKIEIDNTRSWPTKVLAFYVAVNFGLTGALVEVRKSIPTFHPSICEKVTLTTLVAILALWSVAMLVRNNRNYLKYRNVQVNFQLSHRGDFKPDYKLPDDWFKPGSECPLSRWVGWGFYAWIVLVAAVLSAAGIWVVV